jgi:hypothetical protein
MRGVYAEIFSAIGVAFARRQKYEKFVKFRFFAELGKVKLKF